MANIEFDGTITLATSVSDLERSINWFENVLGFKELFRAPEGGWAEVSTPVEYVSIGLGEHMEVEGKGGTTPVFGVKDIAAARTALESAGVKFAGDTVELPGLVKLATFYDPDGNSYDLAESLMSDEWTT